MPSEIINNEGEIKEVDATYLIPPQQGELHQYYGRIGSGKSYIATRNIIDDLNSGLVVKANIPILWNGYDQLDDFKYRLLGILGLKKKFYIFPKENYTYFDITDTWAHKHGYEDFHHWLGSQTSCIIYIDEGHLAYDSYELARMRMEKRLAILDTRHYDRTIVVISQRPTAIHASLRGNVHRFFKCENNLNFKIPFTNKKIMNFLFTEFQDVDQNDRPNEEIDEETKEYKYAIRTDLYWGRKKFFKAYNTKFRRGNTPESQSDLNILKNRKWIEMLKRKHD